MSEKPIRVVEGLSLIIGNDDGTIDNADVRVRWCVTPELTKSLIDQGIKNPHILLMTYDPMGNTEWRKIFPLNEVMSFARFYQPGSMKIAAYIMDMPEEPANVRIKIDSYMQYDEDRYRIMMQQGGRLQNVPRVDQDPIYATFHAGTSETVIIPEGVFDKEAPKWLEWYANLWHGRNGPEDACGFRTRLIIGLFKWIPMTVWLAFFYFMSAIFLGLTWLTGMQKWIITYHPLKHPFVPESLFSMHDNDEGEHGNLLDSRFIGWLTWPHGIRQPLIAPAMLAPFFPLLMFFIVWLGSDHGGILDVHQAHVAAAYGTFWLFIIAVIWDVCVAIGNIMELMILKRTTRRGKEMTFDGAVVFMIVVLMSIVVAITSFEPMFLTLIGAAIFVVVFGSWVYNKPWVSGAADEYFTVLDNLYYKFISLFSSRDDYTEMRELLCPQDLENLSTKLDSLPSRNISWRLRFKNVKAAVCKPRVRRR